MKGHQNHFYKDGYFAGYGEYRYGDAAKNAPQLPPIFSDDRRKHAVTVVRRLMEGWQLTLFEKEGVTVAGIRSSLCLHGYDFARSDKEARKLVAEALEMMNAERPTWEEGQRGYVESRDKCRRCGSDLDDEQMAKRLQFCSAECARFALTRWGFDARESYDKAYMRVHHEWATLAAKPRPCAHCGKMFRSRVKASVYCSVACRGAARRTVPDRNCRRCGTLFRPLNSKIVFCSLSCSHNYRNENAPLVHRECDWCGTAFEARATAKPRRYCSIRCKSAANHTQKGELKTLSPLVFDFVMKMAA